MSQQQSEEEKINALVVEIRLLENTYNELTARQSIVERVVVESKAALDAIMGLSNVKPNQILVPIGAGAMLKFPAPETDRVMINIGSDVVIEKSKEEAITMLQNRLKEAENSLNTLMTQRNQVAQRLEADRQLLESLVRQAQQG
jgi:prefoldin alpha subunit